MVCYRFSDNEAACDEGATDSSTIHERRGGTAHVGQLPRWRPRHVGERRTNPGPQRGER